MKKENYDIDGVLKFHQLLQKAYNEKINQVLYKGYKWVAIDKDGSINAFGMKPFIDEGDVEWYCNRNDNKGIFHICTIETTCENWKESLLQIAPEDKRNRITKKVCIEDTNSIFEDLGGDILCLDFIHHCLSDYEEYIYNLQLLNGKQYDGNAGDEVEVVIEDGKVIEIKQ